MVPDAARPPSPPRPSQHEIHLSPAAARAHEPLVPVVDGGSSAIPCRQLARIRLDPVAASSAPDDQARARRRSAAERRGRAAVGFHLTNATIICPIAPRAATPAAHFAAFAAACAVLSCSLASFAAWSI